VGLETPHWTLAWTRPARPRPGRRTSRGPRAFGRDFFCFFFYFDQGNKPPGPPPSPARERGAPRSSKRPSAPQPRASTPTGTHPRLCRPLPSDAAQPPLASKSTEVAVSRRHGPPTAPEAPAALSVGRPSNSARSRDRAASRPGIGPARRPSRGGSGTRQVCRGGAFGAGEQVGWVRAYDALLRPPSRAVEVRCHCRPPPPPPVALPPADRRRPTFADGPPTVVRGVAAQRPTAVHPPRRGSNGLGRRTKAATTPRLPYLVDRVGLGGSFSAAPPAGAGPASNARKGRRPRRVCAGAALRRLRAPAAASVPWARALPSSIAAARPVAAPSASALHLYRKKKNPYFPRASRGTPLHRHRSHLSRPPPSASSWSVDTGPGKRPSARAPWFRIQAPSERLETMW